MGKRRIVVLGVYFGPLPNSFELWMKSCSCNKDIDFMVFTDQHVSTVPDNVHIKKMTLTEFSSLASKKLGIKNLWLNKPYKCCDFKAVYGKILEDYIKKYDFWGHCDFDLIFGDILSVISEEIWKKNDKILPLGHLSFYRNTKEVNDRYKAKGSKVGSYLDVFTQDKAFLFDELGGIVSIYESNGYPLYTERVFADISVIYSRFRLALKDKNYKYQVFYWENGHVYRAYFDQKKKRIRTDEFAYIHFKKRKNLKILISDIRNCESFYITEEGFVEKKLGVPSLEDIKKHNPYKGLLYEKVELLQYHIKKLKA